MNNSKDGIKKLVLVGVLAAVAYMELGPAGLILAGVIMMIF